MSINAGHPHRTVVLVVALTAVCGGFWADCIFGPHTPLAAGFQAQMQPWASEADLPGTDRQWSPLLWDGVAQFYPWRLLAARAMRDGELALWNPHQMCGYPFVGNGQSALFYPPNWLLAFVDVKWGLGLLAALHYALAAVLTALLCRTLGLGHLPSAFAALAFTFGGFMVTWTELPTLMNSATWLPGALLGGALVFRRSRWGLPVLGGALAMTLLAGHLQIAAYVWLATAVYALTRLVWEAVNGRSMRLMTLAGAVAIALLLAAPQVLPSLELAANSTRGSGGPSEAGWQFHKQRALQVAELVLLTDPDALGSPVDGDHELTRYGIPYSEHAGFVGLSTLVLALTGLAFRRTRHHAFFLVLALLTLSVAMGGPLARLMYFGVPKLGQAGGFPRILSVFTFAAAMAGAFGLDGARRWMASAWQDRSDRGLREELFAAGMVLVLAGELLPWAHDFLPKTRREHVYPVTPAIERLQAAEDRVLAVTPMEEWGMARVPEAVLPPNAATVYGYDSIAGYDSLMLTEYRAYLARAEGREPSPAVNGNMLLPQQAAGPRQMLMGVSMAMARRQPRADGVQEIEPIYGPGGVGLYGVEPVAPRAFTVPTPGWTSMLLAGPADQAMAAVEGCDWSRAGTNRMIIERPPDDTNRSLVVTETFYPGWSAYSGGETRELEPAREQIFRRVTLEPTDRQVHLVFEPVTVRAGCFLGLLGLGALAGFAVFGRRIGRDD
jgi:hypothetical protein